MLRCSKPQLLHKERGINYIHTHSQCDMIKLTRLISFRTVISLLACFVSDMSGICHKIFLKKVFPKSTLQAVKGAKCSKLGWSKSLMGWTKELKLEVRYKTRNDNWFWLPTNCQICLKKLRSDTLWNWTLHPFIYWCVMTYPGFHWPEKSPQHWTRWWQWQPLWDHSDSFLEDWALLLPALWQHTHTHTHTHTHHHHHHHHHHQFQQFSGHTHINNSNKARKLECVCVCVCVW